MAELVQLVPAISLHWHGRAPLSGMRGTRLHKAGHDESQ